MSQNLLVLREPPAEVSVKGEMFLDGGFFCFTLERIEVMIPAGTYPVELRQSPRFGTEVPWIKDVPGRQWIEIHYGNFPADTEGCVLVGYGEGKEVIWTSRKAFDDLVKLIREAEGPTHIQLMDA